MNKQIIKILLLLLACIVLPFPNSFQLPAAALIVLVNILILIETKKNIIDSYFIFWWLLLSICFMFYIGISPLKLTLQLELILKYILFPICWVNIFSYIKKYMNIEAFTKIIIGFSFFSFLVVIFLYTTMLMGYRFIDFFIENPNIDNNFFIGFTLHVYGNLIFFAAGIFIIKEIIKNTYLQIAYILLFAVVAILSARTALIASLTMGVIIFFIQSLLSKNYGMVVRYVLTLIVLIFTISYITDLYLNYSFFDYFNMVSIRKIKEFGGIERASQTTVILDNIIQNPWGVGFKNMGIERNATKNFQYEVLILATVARYGVLVFSLIVLSISPFIINAWQFAHQNSYRKFYILGFISIILFSFTNPYLESFSFEWMYFCPLVFLHEKKP